MTEQDNLNLIAANQLDLLLSSYYELTSNEFIYSYELGDDARREDVECTIDKLRSFSGV